MNKTGVGFTDTVWVEYPPFFFFFDFRKYLFRYVLEYLGWSSLVMCIAKIIEIKCHNIKNKLSPSQ